MNTIEIPAIGVCREIPSKWSEMTPEQARVTMRLLCLLYTSDAADE